MLLCPWDSPGKTMGEGCHSLLQGIFLTQGSDPSLLHWQVGGALLSPQGSPSKRLPWKKAYGALPLVLIRFGISLWILRASDQRSILKRSCHVSWPLRKILRLAALQLGPDNFHGSLGHRLPKFLPSGGRKWAAVGEKEFLIGSLECMDHIEET